MEILLDRSSGCNSRRTFQAAPCANRQILQFLTQQGNCLPKPCGCQVIPVEQFRGSLTIGRTGSDRRQRWSNDMSESEFVEILRSSVNELLRWVGFGTLTGLAAKAILPGRDPGGAVSTMLTGIAGSVIGCGTAMFFWRDASIDPISVRGFFAAVLGAFILLFFYRLLSGSFFRETNDGEDRWLHKFRRRVKRRYIADDALRDMA
jgi:uncharacterized membrane protein YeaQ/YmgE (transglycosylase-associated protein family)